MVFTLATKMTFCRLAHLGTPVLTHLEVSVTALDDSIKDYTNWLVATALDTRQSIANSSFITLSQLTNYACMIRTYYLWFLQ